MWGTASCRTGNPLPYDCSKRPGTGCRQFLVSCFPQLLFTRLVLFVFLSVSRDWRWPEVTWPEVTWPDVTSVRGRVRRRAGRYRVSSPIDAMRPCTGWRGSTVAVPEIIKHWTKLLVFGYIYATLNRYLLIYLYIYSICSYTTNESGEMRNCDLKNYIHNSI